jgi:DNA-binding MarR family transcriptional regulator
MATERSRKLRVLRGYDGPPEGRGHAALISLMRVSGRLNDVVSRMVKGHGLTLPHFDVLMSIKAGEGISQQDVSDQLLVTKGNVCVIVQKLEAAELLERRVDPRDQRVHRLYLTDGSRRLLASILPDERALFRQILGALTMAEQKTLHELLLRIDQAFDDVVS